jgi:hypothetical protein
MVLAAIAPIVVAEQFNRSFDQVAPLKIRRHPDLHRAVEPPADAVGPLALASRELADEQIARVALLVHARRRHRGPEVRQPAEHAISPKLVRE